MNAKIIRRFPERVLLRQAWARPRPPTDSPRSPRAKSEAAGKADVETYKHREAKRKNIPTAENQKLIAADDKAIKKLRQAAGETRPRYLRVVTLEDGETVHNAFFDRNFHEEQR